MNTNELIGEVRVLAICGFARSGKDTLFSTLNRLRPGLFQRYALADALKSDLEPLCQKMFGGRKISQLNATEKEIFRSVLISYGCAWRAIDINHWTKIVQKKIEWDNAMLHGIWDSIRQKIACLTDARFPSEVEFFEQIYGPSFVLVEVIRTDYTGEPPEEELRNHPYVAAKAKYRVEWPTLEPNELGKLDEYGEKLLRQMEL